MQADASGLLGEVKRKQSDIQHHIKLLNSLKELRSFRREAHRKTGIYNAHIVSAVYTCTCSHNYMQDACSTNWKGARFLFWPVYILSMSIMSVCTVIVTAAQVHTTIIYISRSVYASHICHLWCCR